MTRKKIALIAAAFIAVGILLIYGYFGYGKTLKTSILKDENFAGISFSITSDEARRMTDFVCRDAVEIFNKTQIKITDCENHSIRADIYGSIYNRAQLTFFDEKIGFIAFAKDDRMVPQNMFQELALKLDSVYRRGALNSVTKSGGCWDYSNDFQLCAWPSTYTDPSNWSQYEVFNIRIYSKKGIEIINKIQASNK